MAQRDVSFASYDEDVRGKNANIRECVRLKAGPQRKTTNDSISQVSKVVHKNSENTGPALAVGTLPSALVNRQGIAWLPLFGI